MAALINLLKKGFGVENEIAQGTSQLAGAAGATVVAGKATAAAMGTGLAGSAVMVMMWLRPKTIGELATALISTAFSCLCIGSAVVTYFNLGATLSHDAFGAITLAGIHYAAGVPGWSITRWVFNYLEKSRNKSIDEVVGEWKDKT